LDGPAARHRDAGNHLGQFLCRLFAEGGLGRRGHGDCVERRPRWSCGWNRAGPFKSVPLPNSGLAAALAAAAAAPPTVSAQKKHLLPAARSRGRARRLRRDSVRLVHSDMRLHRRRVRLLLPIQVDDSRGRSRARLPGGGARLRIPVRRGPR